MRWTVVMAAVLGCAAAAAAQTAPADGNAVAEAFKAGRETMMGAMDVPLTGDADRDFVTGMLPHHQGAVDMALIELRYGHDPAMRALAQSIITAQEKEIGEMQAWEKAHPGP